jgi:general secretion pathway protein A
MVPAILPAMYASFFGLQQEPFSIAPDPRFLYMSEMHREALAHLLYGAAGRRRLRAADRRDRRRQDHRVPLLPGAGARRLHQVAYIVNPKLTPGELLQTVCRGVRHPAAG